MRDLGVMDWVVLGTLVGTFIILIGMLIYMVYRNNVLLAEKCELGEYLRSVQRDYTNVCDQLREIQSNSSDTGKHHIPNCSAAEEMIEELYRVFPPEMYQIDGDSIGLVIPEHVLMSDEGPEKVRALRFLANYYKDLVEFASTTVDHRTGGMRIVFRFLKEGVW